MKVCNKCGGEKEEEFFYKTSKTKDGLYSQCKVCMSYTNKPFSFSHTWYKERFTPEELELFSKLRNLCTKAKLRKQDFDPEVDWEYLFDLWSNQNGRCAYSGLPLSVEVNHPHTVSLDRIDSSKGYERGNLQLLSFTVNRMKMDLNEQDFLEICGHVANHRSK